VPAECPPLDLVDEPYRSVAGALKRAGAYKKDKVPLAIRRAQSCDTMVLHGWRGASNVVLDMTLNAPRLS
jgi:hypothetical protein